MSGIALGIIAALSIVGIAVLFAGISLAGNLLYICEPNEVLIFSGRNRTTEDGRKVGYRVVFGGRAYDNTADAHAGRDGMSVFSFLDEDVGGLSNLSL